MPAATPADRLRSFLSRWVVSPLQGVTFGDWIRVLRENRFRVGLRFWPRAALTTLSSVNNAWQARRELRIHGAAIASTVVERPVFILGHYRCGTTHLHNLLAADGRFGFINNYQANFPRTFLLSEALGSRLGAALAIRKRPHDNVALDLRVPTEDELALCADTFLSPHMGWHFPRRSEYYNRRFLTFSSASDVERARWIASIRGLARKLTLKYGRQLVLKSPLHTARVPLLLEAFPDALFVHVHRDPYRVYLSTRNMELKVEPMFRYQASRPETLEERIFWRYRTMYEAYLRDRALIPTGSLTEVAYEDLDRDPVATLEGVYRALRLPQFEEARGAISAYLDTLGEYQRNVYADIRPEAAIRVREEWGFCFEEWGYER